MAQGLSKTFDILAATHNEAAVDVLAAALDLPRRDIREAAFQALLARPSQSAENEILRRWTRLSDRWKTLVAQKSGWISSAVRKAVRSGNEDRHAAGCDAALWTRDYDLIPLLVGAAIDPQNPHASRAALTALQLAELLCEELAAGRDYRIRRDPQLQRQYVLASLEQSATDFEKHGRRELVEAFLLLAERDNAVLGRILQGSHETSSQPLVEVLTASPRPGIERLLLSFLDDPHAPLAAVQLVARRRDVAFLRHLLRKIGIEPSPAIRTNLRRIESIPWMQDQLSLIDALSEAEQPGAVQLATLSGIHRQKALEAVAYILRHGKAAGRRAAATALADFGGAEANALAVRALDDDDPLVRSAVAVQLRKRGIPGAMNRLIELLDSAQQVERQAAQASLEEFTFDRFLANFDTFGEEARRTTGALVKRVDPSGLSKIRLELDAQNRTRRKRGLELVAALGAALEMLDPVSALLKDEDQYLRIEAIRVLATCDHQRTRMILREAALDPHPLVVEAAEAALAQLTLGAETLPVLPRATDTVPFSTIGPRPLVPYEID